MITINVTKEHIDNGIAIDFGHCPIALSLKQSQKKSVFVACDEIHIGNRIYVPADIEESSKIKTFINRFDKGESVNPTTLKIKVKK